jgi:hypothetical protein
MYYLNEAARMKFKFRYYMVDEMEIQPLPFDLVYCSPGHYYMDPKIAKKVLQLYFEVIV